MTAEFNRNVLHVLNRELDADFDPDSFEHVAFFDREHEWIEMRLRARRRASAAHRARSTWRSTSPPARRCAPRSAPSSPPSACAATLPRPGWSSSAGYTDPEELFALSLSRLTVG